MKFSTAYGQLPTQKAEEEMDPLFEVHMLNDTGKPKARAIAEIFDTCLANLAGIIPPGREMSVVKTNLETACFFAKKAMANQPENQA
jgi:hypothetical protein